MKTWAFPRHWMVFPCLWQNSRKSEKCQFPLTCVLVSTRLSPGKQKVLKLLLSRTMKKKRKTLLAQKECARESNCWIKKEHQLGLHFVLSPSANLTNLFPLKTIWETNPSKSPSPLLNCSSQPPSLRPPPSLVLLIWPLLVSKLLQSNRSPPFLTV